MTLPLTAVLTLAMLTAQLTPQMTQLVAAVRPLLPFPGATDDGDLPVDNSADSRWFVVWPTEADDARILVRANPLHPDVQQQGAAAMEEINAAVAAAERRAQASYDRALEQLRRTGKSTELETITLEDEGVAGERIDAELEVAIELGAADSFEITSGVAPTVTAGPAGTWILSIPANVYRLAAGTDRRERFRAAESHVYLGMTAPPTVQRIGDDSRFRVSVAADTGAFTVWIRGNASLVSTLTNDTDWSRLVSR